MYNASDAALKQNTILLAHGRFQSYSLVKHIIMTGKELRNLSIFCVAAKLFTRSDGINQL
jgi:hypothetical protein